MNNVLTYKTAQHASSTYQSTVAVTFLSEIIFNDYWSI